MNQRAIRYVCIIFGEIVSICVLFNTKLSYQVASVFFFSKDCTKMLSSVDYMLGITQEQWAVSPSVPTMDGVRYPDDFANEPPRAPSHHYQPVPPLIPPSRPQA